MVPAVSDRIPRVPPYSGAGPSPTVLPLRGCHPLRPAFPGRSGSIAGILWPALLPRLRLDGAGLGSSHFARHYSGNRFFFLLLRVLRCFSSPGSPTSRCDGPSARRVAPFGHARINFAACRVLHRLRKPRHPPSALVTSTLVFRHSGSSPSLPVKSSLLRKDFLASFSLPRYLSQYCQ